HPVWQPGKPFIMSHGTKLFLGVLQAGNVTEYPNKMAECTRIIKDTAQGQVKHHSLTVQVPTGKLTAPDPVLPCDHQYGAAFVDRQGRHAPYRLSALRTGYIGIGIVDIDNDAMSIGDENGLSGILKNTQRQSLPLFRILSAADVVDRKSTRLNSSHVKIS